MYTYLNSTLSYVVVNTLLGKQGWVCVNGKLRKSRSVEVIIRPNVVEEREAFPLQLYQFGGIDIGDG